MPLWIIAATSTAGNAAVFSVGLQLSTLAVLPAIAINLAGSPIIAQLNAAREFASLRPFLQWLSYAAAVPAAGTAAILFLWGHDFMTFLFGSPYRASSLVAAIVCLGRAIQALSGPGETVLAMTGGERTLTVVLISALLLATPVYLVASHIAGITQVAIVTASMLALQGIALALILRRRFGFWPGGIKLS